MEWCPWALVPHDDDAWTYLRWWNEWKSLGVFPFPGGMDDQPYYVYEAFEICERTFADVEAGQQKKQQKDYNQAVKTAEEKKDQ